MLGAATSVVVSRRASAQRVIGVVTLALVCVVGAVLLVARTPTGRSSPSSVAGPPRWASCSSPTDVGAAAAHSSSVVTLAVLVYAIDQRISDYGRETASTTFHPIFLLLSTGVSLA